MGEMVKKEESLGENDVLGFLEVVSERIWIQQATNLYNMKYYRNVMTSYGAMSVCFLTTVRP